MNGHLLVERPDALSPDDLLQMSRRLDWRFLLPDSSLEDVGYVGEAQGTLLTALRVFSGAVHVMPPASHLEESVQRRFDIVVLSSPPLTLLHRANRLLNHGGWLYAEVERWRWRSPSIRLRPPASYAAAAVAGGLTEVQLFWHWPRFDACTRIIPLDDPAALDFLVTRGRNGTSAGIKGAVARRLLRNGAIGWGIPCFSLVAHLPRS